MGTSNLCASAPSMADDVPVPDRICELLRHFYSLGWCTASGGGISIAAPDRSSIFVAPSGVQKERVSPEHVFSLSTDCATVLSGPPSGTLRQSECTPLFAQVYAHAALPAGAVIHSHALETMVASRMFDQEFRSSPSGAFEMAKAFPGYANSDDVIVPIIENTPREDALANALRAALLAYPCAVAVLVRNHGCYIWGETWGKAKTIAEALHYIFAAVERLHVAGIAPVPAGSFAKTPCAPRARMRAWFMDRKVDGEEAAAYVDIRAANRCAEDDRLISHGELDNLGVKHISFTGTEDCEVLAKWKKTRGYNYSDVITCSREGLGEKYPAMIEAFKKEHFHDAAEVRAVLEGSGTFLSSLFFRKFLYCIVCSLF